MTNKLKINRYSIWCLHPDCLCKSKTFNTTYGLQCHLQTVHGVKYNYNYKMSKLIKNNKYQN